jgi:hypothetical protein
MELKKDLVARRISIPNSSIAGQPKIVLMETPLPKAIQRAVGLESVVSVYGMW